MAGENIGANLHDLEFGTGFINVTLQAQAVDKSGGKPLQDGRKYYKSST